MNVAEEVIDLLARIVVIADDLTGANDTGLQFAKKGFCTVSLLDPVHQESAQDADVWVINAETRSLDRKDAYEKNKAIAEGMNLAEIPYVYKKIDSTMRGNIGSEINALLDSCPFDVAAVIPAYPVNRRTTVGGYHIIDQVLLEDSEIARDPKSPVNESHLPTLLREQAKQTVGHIDLKTIRRDKSVLAREIVRQHESGTRLIVFDGYDQPDLQKATQALLDTRMRVLWVGSAGLADALSDELVTDAGAHSAGRGKREREGSSDPVFVIAGSVSAITAGQIEVLNERPQFRIVMADPLRLLQRETVHQELERALQETLDIIDGGYSPVLVTDSSEQMRQAVANWMKQTGTSGLAAGNAIADCLGMLGVNVQAKRKLRGFVLTGGDIAYRTCLHLQVKALQIVSEVEEGIPLSVIIGGPADKLPVVTKAGAFGNRFSLAKAVEKINTYEP
jgi:uncharacterized protein YgbK (DUF1537 family)